MESTSTQTPVLLTIRELRQTTKMGRSFVYQEIQAGRFPRPVKLGRSSRWLATEIHEWVNAQACARSPKTAG
ncbi:MAG: helix-turn-helix transcriptional regulator [Limnohabitans sp.]